MGDHIYSHARGEDGFVPSKFLVCVDDSDVSRIALRFACIKAKKRGFRVEMIHVIEPGDVQALNLVADKMYEEQLEAAEKFTKKLAQEAENQLGISPDIVIRNGGAGEEIIQQLKSDQEANMLVFGVSTNRSSSAKLISWIAGQMGEDLMVPVMLVPGSLTDQQMVEVS